MLTQYRCWPPQARKKAIHSLPDPVVHSTGSAATMALAGATVPTGAPVRSGPAYSVVPVGRVKP
jgi:hypothetical protein